MHREMPRRMRAHARSFRRPHSSSAARIVSRTVSRTGSPTIRRRLSNCASRRSNSRRANRSQSAGRRARASPRFSHCFRANCFPPKARCESQCAGQSKERTRSANFRPLRAAPIARDPSVRCFRRLNSSPRSMFSRTCCFRFACTPRSRSTRAPATPHPRRTRRETAPHHRHAFARRTPARCDRARTRHATETHPRRRTHRQPRPRAQAGDRNATRR